MTSIAFIGAGKVGTALAVKLAQQGYPVVAVASRSVSSAERLASLIPGCRPYLTPQEAADAAELVFITTPDDVIPQMACQVAWRPDHGVVHCSGADSASILDPARERGAQVGVFHPLQTLASLEEALENLPGSTFSIEAQGSLLESLKEMATALEGRWIVLRAEDRVLYHAAAVIVCNYLVTLMKMATDLWQFFGVSPQEATSALLPLVRGTVHNLETVGLPMCLTGPIARGDLGTVAKHLEALRERAPQFLPTYRELGLQTIPIALAGGRIDAQQGRRMEEVLRGMEMVGSEGKKGLT
ncbi:MAG: DUF2520 domain-containing protein [Chloroflexi bacterium]|nr:DUF2520 domain-containing protein [Chloroflexota bacterium]